MKLCPICDHELTAGSYCPVCRKLVTNPLVLSDDVYLNKSHYGFDGLCEFLPGDRRVTYLNRSHPKNEKECSYHHPEISSKAEEIQRLLEKNRRNKP